MQIIQSIMQSAELIYPLLSVSPETPPEAPGRNQSPEANDFELIVITEILRSTHSRRHTAAKDK